MEQPGTCTEEVDWKYFQRSPENKITTQERESAVEKYWQLFIKSSWVFDSLIYPTVNLTHLLGFLIDISHTTWPKLNSWNPPQKTSLIAFAVSVNNNSILLVAQAKNLGFMSQFTLCPSCHQWENPFDSMMLWCTIWIPLQDRSIYPPSCNEQC